MILRTSCDDPVIFLLQQFLTPAHPPGFPPFAEPGLGSQELSSSAVVQLVEADL